jgi:acyl transferase domain-containing protein
VAAASLSVPTEAGYLAEECGIRSPDGHCRPFDANSNGTVFASGVAGVLLRRLDDAIASGDSILAVIRATAINNDGNARVGFTAPGLQGQVDVISEALQVAQVDAADLAYVECHGTGTRLGDPIEIGALDQAWRANSTHDLPPRHCLVGSVKSNIGHLDTVAGLAGLIKTACCLHHGEIPPTLHYASPNPEIGLARTPFHVADQRQTWPANRKRLAGVSAFGFGGTNAHAVLEAAPAASETACARSWHCLVLSAADEPALQRQAGALADWIEKDPGADLADIGYTLQVGRRALAWRGVLLASDATQAVAGLRRITGVQSQATTSPLWLFPGQGAHYPGMASALYAAEPAFRDALSRMLLMLPKNAPVDTIRGLLLDPGGAQIDDTAIVQPALFIYEVALGQTLLALGLVPSALLGHSLGELSAACLAGVFEPAQACSLVCLRGALMADLPPGSMVLVHCDAESVGARLSAGHPALDLAVVNSPACCVVGGPRDAIDAFASAAQALGWQPRQLRTSHAFHTRMMDPALARYRQAIRERVLSQPRWPLLSGQDGQWLSGERAIDPEYWVQQLRQPVRFDQALASTMPTAVVEVGPGGGLLAFARDTSRMPAVMLSIGGNRYQDASTQHGHFVQGIARLWQAGDAVDWLAFNQPWLPRRRVGLPPYPFARERHWLPSSLPALQALREGNATLAPIQTPAGSTIPAGPLASHAQLASQPRPALETPIHRRCRSARRLLRPGRQLHSGFASVPARTRVRLDAHPAAGLPAPRHRGALRRPGNGGGHTRCASDG